MRAFTDLLVTLCGVDFDHGRHGNRFVGTCRSTWVHAGKDKDAVAVGSWKVTGGSTSWADYLLRICFLAKFGSAAVPDSCLSQGRFNAPRSVHVDCRATLSRCCGYDTRAGQGWPTAASAMDEDQVLHV